MEDMFAQSLKDYPEEHFDELDTVSIKKLMVAAIGHFGATAREAAIDMLERYITWVKKQPQDSFDDVGIDPMEALKKMEDDVYYLKKYTPDYENKEEIGKKFMEFKKSFKNE